MKEPIFCQGDCQTKRGYLNFYQANKKTVDQNKSPLIVNGRLAFCKHCLMIQDITDYELAEKLFKAMDYAYSKSGWDLYIRRMTLEGTDITFKKIFGYMLSTYAMQKPTYAESAEIEARYRIQALKEEKDMATKEKTLKMKKILDEKQRKRSKQIDAAVKKKQQEMEAEMFIAEKKRHQIQPKDLTEDDVEYLKDKWGDSYSKKELINLEKSYVDMLKRGDAQDPVFSDYIKKIAKISFLMDKALDDGDEGSWKDLGSLYDKLIGSVDMKANKDRDDVVDSISEIVTICESAGFIELDSDIVFKQDKVDLTIDTMQKYTKTLVSEETSLPKIIKNTLEEMVQTKMISAKELVEMLSMNLDNPDDVKFIKDLLVEEGG